MIKRLSSVGLISLAVLVAAPAAFADVAVNVNADGYKHHRHHRVVAEAPRRHRHSNVYYNGDYAYVARDNGATIVHAYPGVDVFVGAGGGVSVNVGY
jgi:hypothetical protein